MQARDPELLCISARSENALRALAGRYARFLVEESRLPLADVCFTAGARRAHHAHRLAVVGADGPELAAALEAHAEAGRDERADDPRGVGFLCSAAPGYPGLGRRLLETEVEFGRGLTRLDDELGKPVARSVMRSIAAGKRPDDAGLLCIELALAHLWRSLGVEVVDVVGTGIGIGRLAADCLSGRLGLREAFSMLDDPADAEPAAEEWSLTVELGARSQRNGSVRVVGSLSAERDERVAFLEAAGALWETGESIDLARLFPAGARVVSLPHTPWERRRLPSVRGVAPVNGRPAPEPARKQPATAREALEPGELASKIRALVARALGLDAGELDDCAGLSELGLDSLMAMELQEAAARELGIELPVEALVESASIEELATLAREVEEDLPRLVPEPGAADQPFPLTPIQYAYWVGRTSAYELGGVSCHLHVELDCVGLDVGRLAGAVDGVVARHPMLRAVVDDDGSQRVLDGIAGYEPVVVDLRGHDDVEVELRRLRAQWSHEVRPAREWPLFEFRVVWVDDGRARLFVSLDLLLADGASLFRLGRELCALYADPAAELEPVGVSFRDYVLAERELRGGSRWRRDWEYWSSRLDELPAAPELPLARDVSDVREPRFERHSVVMDGDRWARLREHAAGMGLTASGLLCAGFAEVLGRFSGGGPFTLNLTSYSRLPVHEDVGRVIGDFTSLTLLEVDGEGERFADRARRLQAQLWRDLEHRRVNGVEVLRELARRRGRREAAMPVVFTSTLGLEHEGSGFPLEELGELVYAVSQTPQVWLDHQVVPRGAGVELSWDAVDELFPDGFLDAMFESYRALVERLADDPGVLEESDPVELPAEQQRAVAAANDTAVELGTGRLEDGFLARAAADPDAIAVFDGETTLTYAELERLSGAVAERVAARGELVAVSMRKGWEQVAAVLGVLRAGAAYVPIDPDQPPDRVARLLERVETRVVLTQPELVEQIAWPAGVDPIAIDEHGSGQAPDPGGGPDDLAYVIFTSGSTGEPKGVMIDHGAALNTVLDINRRFEVNARDRVLALSALSFDLSVWDVFGTLAAGATIVVPDPDGTRDPAHWVALAEQERVTVWNSVPALMRLALEHAAAQRTRLPDSLRLVMLSGDWIPLDLPGQLAEYSNARLISLGGATEASIWSIHHPVGGSLDGWDSIPYGDPLANQRWHVLDRRGRECPDWVTGELHIAGDGLALGYWRDPDRTDTAFITREGERLYRTGDLGRRRPGATIEFLGRSDDQVKVNGFRIELGEIEAALTGHPKIVQAVCAAPGPREERRLAAYYMTNAEPPAPAELRNHLAEILPQWMIPTTYTPIESLPLTANGKLDRSRLPDPLQPAAPVATDDDPVSVIVADAMQNGQAGPLSTASVLSLVERARDELAGEVSLEDVLVAAISERLRAHVASLTGSEVEAISVGAPLNTIGLDSLKALELGNKLVDETGVELPLGMVADGLALGEIAARLAPAVAANFGLGDAEVDAGDGDEPRPTLVPAPVDAFEPFPLNPIQEAYWIGRRPELELGGVSCHLHLEFDCTGLDVGRLGRAMRGLVARHGMLRAVVDEDGSQRVLEGVSDYEPVVVDLRDRDDVEPELRRLREAWSHEVRPAGEWPLFEFRVVRTDENRARLFVSLDLLPADGASLFQLGRELSALYSDPAAQLEPVGVSFRDYVLAERELRGGSRWQRDWDYWSSRLDALPAAPDLPLARDVSEVGEARFERRSVVLDGERWRQLRDRASAAGLTASGLLSAAFAEVLGSFSGGGPFTLNLTSYSRLPVHEDVGRVIGDFTSLTLLEVDGEGERFLDRARRLQTQLWRDLEHRRVNGVELLRELARRRGRRAAAMPVVFTSTLGLEQEGSGFPLEELGELVYAVSQTPQVWLDHQVVERGDGVELSWDVVEHLFPDGFLDAMFESYRALVERLADDPGVLEESDPIELPGEQRRMVAAAKETAGGLDRSRVADPERPRTTTGRQGPPPGSSERLAELVAAALGVDEVDPAASLLDLGATSLQLVRLQAAIRAELGVEIGLDELFVAASVNDIGEILVVPIPQ